MLIVNRYRIGRVVGIIDDFNPDATEIDLVARRPPMSDGDRCPGHVFERAEIEGLGRMEQSIICDASAEDGEIGYHDVIEAMEIAGMIEMEMRRHRGDRQGRQASRHRRYVVQTGTGVEEESAFTAADEIVPVD